MWTVCIWHDLSSSKSRTVRTCPGSKKSLRNLQKKAGCSHCLPLLPRPIAPHWVLAFRGELQPVHRLIRTIGPWGGQTPHRRGKRTESNEQPAFTVKRNDEVNTHIVRVCVRVCVCAEFLKSVTVFMVFNSVTHHGNSNNYYVSCYFGREKGIQETYHSFYNQTC